MDVAGLIRHARMESTLTQSELARLSGTSQPTLAAYEAGRALPRLDTLERLLECSGHDLVISIRPKARRGAVPMIDVGREIAKIATEEGGSGVWRRLLDFVDDFRGSSTAGKRWLVNEEPALVGDVRFDAALAGVVDFLCNESDLAPPAWTAGPDRLAQPFWFVSGLPGFEAMALRDTPVALGRHGVFVNEGAFERV
jgi:transcriptional regulator with XRE-family HTH domain